MITIISGTNRANSKSSEVARIVENIVKTKTDKVHLLDLAEISDYGISSMMYNPDNQSSEIAKIQDEILMPADKWILVLPEYNGGIPGIFKLLIDAISVRNKDGLMGKNVLLIGVAAGRAGNLRGLDYATNCLNYLGMFVHPQKLPISSFNSVLKDGQLDEGTTKALKSLINDFA
jgi:NAD(P)H-dependent FMN reductase